MDVISVLVLLLVCVFTAADDSLNITCEDVTGHVGVQFNLTCRVSYKINTNCMKMYKIINKDKATEICREEFTSDSCVQLTSISCPYTANEVMRTTFKFFTQTKQGEKAAEFTVTTSEDTARVAKLVETAAAKSGSPEENRTGHTGLAMTGIFICLFILVLVGVILRRKYNCTNNLNGVGDREENNISDPTNIEKV